MAKADGIGLGMAAAGGVLIYAGIKGKSIPSLIQAFVQGKSPASAPESQAALDAQSSVAAGAGQAAPQSGSGAYSQAQLQELWIANGGASDTAAFAARVALAESSGNAKVTSSNPDGGTNVGLWQLDTPGGVGAGHSVAQLQDPNLNAAVTIMATGNGIHWKEWADPVTDALPGGTYTPGG